MTLRINKEEDKSDDLVLNTFTDAAKSQSVSMLFGSLASVLGGSIYFLVAWKTGYEFSLIAILIGFMVGIAVKKGSGGVFRIYPLASCIGGNGEFHESGDSGFWDV
jgi:phosphate/sulfate permease